MEITVLYLKISRH